MLLDDARHESRREVARAVGAAGYVIRPEDPGAFVARLGKLVDSPGKRRFTRYAHRVSARLPEFDRRCLATEVGRGGVFLAVDDEVELHRAMHCEIALPELSRSVEFEAEVLYRAATQAPRPGLGLRFTNISEADEAALIEYLKRIEGGRA